MFADPRMVAAIVDRVTFKAHILETGTQSYWLRTSKNTSSRKPSQTNPHPQSRSTGEIRLGSGL